MSWHNSFIAALAEEDEKRLTDLLDSMPPFESVEEMSSALELISEATDRFEAKRSQLKRQMDELRKEKRFLTSTGERNDSLLDLHS